MQVVCRQGAPRLASPRLAPPLYPSPSRHGGVLVCSLAAQASEAATFACKLCEQDYSAVANPTSYFPKNMRAPPHGASAPALLNAHRTATPRRRARTRRTPPHATPSCLVASAADQCFRPTAPFVFCRPRMQILRRRLDGGAQKGGESGRAGAGAGADWPHARDAGRATREREGGCEP